MIFDVNNQGNPFHPSVYEHAWPPPDINDITAPTTTTPQHHTQPTLFHRVAEFFRPRSSILASTPMKNNDIFGETMTQPIAPDTTRLYFINLNGLNLQNNSVKFWELCEELNKADVHLFAAAELNLGTNKFAVRKSLRPVPCVY
jgi:hypothetical protein